MDIKRFAKLLLPKYQKLILEYKVDMKPRYGHGKQANKFLYQIINQNRAVYQKHATDMLELSDVFQNIKLSKDEHNDNEPAWNNGFFPGLDMVALYSFLKNYNPKNFIEIGSGNSTKMARKAIEDYKLHTKITSIDPFPRANIDHLADEVLRMPLEDVENYAFITNHLAENDILFIDNSHRVLPNSDVTVCFLELIPQLQPGVIVHIHDIYLPYDYPQNMCDRFYSEQYMLATLLLANPKRYQVLFPCFFASEDEALAGMLEPLWKGQNTSQVEKHGGSFWFKVME
jgi:hypothetical protein